MYKTNQCYDGEPAMIYRSAGEIRRDIRNVAIKIKEAEAMLDIRSLLMDMLTSAAQREPRKWIPEIEEVVREAAQTLDELRRLKESLDELYEEWREARWALGI